MSTLVEPICLVKRSCEAKKKGIEEYFFLIFQIEDIDALLVTAYKVACVTKLDKPLCNICHLIEKVHY